MWDKMTATSFWALGLVCVCYLTIVYITSRGLIAAPRYRQLQGRIGDAQTQVAVLAAATAEDDSARIATLAAITGRLDTLEKGNAIVWRLPYSSWVMAIALSKLASAWRVLHHAERQLMRLLAPEESAAQLHALRLRLATSTHPDDAKLATELATQLETRPGSSAAVIATVEHLHERENTEAEREYEQQRIALWLATTGLGAVFLLGVTLDHQVTMTLGALGGFLSPLVGVLRAQRPASWGVLVLAPVGGALAAIGGLLLVRMLADPELNLLGHVFLDNSWTAPTRPVALATALLFGFSGTLFSRLALTATGQIAPLTAGRLP